MTPGSMRCLREVKEREAVGYAYEAADASFELLARRLLGGVPHYFDVESYRVMVEQRHNALGELVTVSEAVVKVQVDGEMILSAGEGNGPVNALDVASAQGSRQVPALHRRSRARRLQGAHPQRRHRRHHPRSHRKPRRQGQPLVHRRRVAEHRRCFLSGVARLRSSTSSTATARDLSLGSAGAAMQLRECGA